MYFVFLIMIKQKISLGNLKIKNRQIYGGFFKLPNFELHN
jgi:hypothetical protein